MSSVILNYAFLPSRLTGLGVYATNALASFQGINATLVTPDSTDKNISGIDLRSSPQDVRSDLGSRAQLKRLIWTETQLPKFRKHKSDIIFSPVPEAPIFSCRKIVVVHDLIPLVVGNASSRLKMYFSGYVLPLIRRADLVITDSNCTKNDILKLSKISADRINVIPLGVDTEKFNPTNVNSVKGQYFLYVGRHDRYKNIDKVIEAFKRLNNTEYRLKIVGPENPKETQYLRDIASRLKISHKVDFLSFVPDSALVDLIRNATALVHMSAYEGFGLTVLEAMAAGTAVICSNAAALSEVVGHAAIQCNYDDIDMLAENLSLIVNDRKIRNELEREGLIHAQKYKWTNMQIELRNLILQFI